MTKPSDSSTQFKLEDLEGHRPSLLKFARLQLRNEAQAEDVVQETLLAALQGAERFTGKASVRTWLTGILKHKIIDQIRKVSREIATEAGVEEGARDEFDTLFDERGEHVEKPSDWGNPEKAFAQKKFFEILERCMEGLPKNTARVFAMREVMGLKTEEICKEIGISTTNCGVLLYRARTALRLCLQERWFGAQR